MGRLIDAYISACDDYGLDGPQAGTLWTLIRGQIIRAALELGSLSATAEQMREAYEKTGATPIRRLAEMVASMKQPEEESVLRDDRPRVRTRTAWIGERELVFETGRLAAHAAGACLVASGTGSALAWLGSKGDPRADALIGVEIVPPPGDAPRGRELNAGSMQRFLTVLLNQHLFATPPEKYLRVLGTAAAPGSNDVLALNAAAAAAFLGGRLAEAIGTVRVAVVDGAFQLNPSAEEHELATLDLLITGTPTGIVSLWGSGRELTNRSVVDAMDVARKPLRSICEAMDGLHREVGRSPTSSARPAADGNMAATTPAEREFLTETAVLAGGHGSALVSYGGTQVLASVLRSSGHTAAAPFSFGLRGIEGRPIDVARYGEFMTRAFAAVRPEALPDAIASTMNVIALDNSFYAASVAAASLAFFDAGIRLSSAVAAVTEVRVTKEGPWVRSTDLKPGRLAAIATIAGTRRGITALMLTSYDGVVDPDALASLLHRTSTGRIELLDQMGETLSAPRHANAVIVPRTAAPEVGRRYKGPITRITPYGAFVEILPGHSGLLHISEMAHSRVVQVTDVFALGDEIEVEVVSIDPDSSRIGLSRKTLIPPPTEEEREEQRSRAHEPRRPSRESEE